MKAKKGECVLNLLCLSLKLLNNKSKNVRTKEERWGRKIKTMKEEKKNERKGGNKGGMRKGRRKKRRREGNIMVMRKNKQ